MTGPTALPPLGDLQWSLDDAVVMGPGTLYNVQTFDIGGADVRTQDAPIAGADGDRFGVDTRSGRLITLALNTDCYTEQEGLDALDVLEGAWDAEDVRSVPGATSILRWRRGTRVRRAYGRPRDCIPDHARDWTGNIGVTATFRTVEPVVYDDIEHTERVPFVPDPVGGLVGPLIGPLVATGQGLSERGFTVGGTRPTWITILVHGPIISPTVEFTDQWSVTLHGTIGENDYVLIDPVPWARDVRQSGGGNAAGWLTAESRELSGMRLKPGHHSAILTGNDPTGTSYADLFWHHCHTAH